MADGTWAPADEAAAGAATARRKLEAAVVQDSYIGQHDLHSFASGAAAPLQSSAVAPAAAGHEPDGMPKEVSEDRLNSLRKTAAEYIERFDLRQALQDMFQKVIRDRPEDPFEFMRIHLRDAAGGVDVCAVSGDIEQIGQQSAKELLESKEQEINLLRHQISDLEASRAKHNSMGHADLEREYNVYEEQVKQQRSLLEQRFAHQLEQERTSLQTTSLENMERQRSELEQQHARHAERQRLEFEQTLSHQVSNIEVLQRKIQELEARATAADSSAAEGVRTMLERQHEDQTEQQQACIDALQRQLKAYESAAAKQSTADRAAGVATSDMDRLRASQSTPPADRAAGLSRDLSTAAAGLSRDPSTAAAAAAAANPKSVAQVGLGAQARLPSPPTSTTLPLAAMSGTTSSLLVGDLSSAGMLSQLLASAYSTPPALPIVCHGTGEGEEEDGAGPSNPEVLVQIADCKDLPTNGIFAWVGEYSARPLYRLLGPEPRYLYFADADIASGWRVVNKMGSDDFVERFLRPTDVAVPVFCESGEMGGRISECKLTLGVVAKISMISSLEEKDSIRTKFGKTFGSSFTKLDGAQRGLTSTTSPIVGIAHALEAQQRAIQLLHSQLSAEAQRREAAEVHAQTMEEAFETLQLRIQAQLPGPPSVATLQELKAASELSAPPGPAEIAGPGPAGAHSRNLILQQDGGTSWGPDLGPGQGPAPRPPVSPKEKKPVPPPTFRRLPSGLRNRLLSGVAAGAALDEHGVEGPPVATTSSGPQKGSGPAAAPLAAATPRAHDYGGDAGVVGGAAAGGDGQGARDSTPALLADGQVSTAA